MGNAIIRVAGGACLAALTSWCLLRGAYLARISQLSHAFETFDSFEELGRRTAGLAVAQPSPPAGILSPTPPNRQPAALPAHPGDVDRQHRQAERHHPKTEYRQEAEYTADHESNTETDPRPA